MNIKIISAYTENISEMAQINTYSISEYCLINSIDHEVFILKDIERPAPWYKIKILIDEFAKNDYEYFLWIDSDAIIYNNKFDISTILKDNKEIYLSKDFNNINSGVILIKKTEFTLKILNKIWEMTEYLNHIWWEQKAIIHLIEENYLNINSVVEFVPQNILNAYDYRYYGFECHDGNFNSNSFVVHFPSLPVETRIHAMKNLLKI